MTRKRSSKIAAVAFAFSVVFYCAGIVSAQWNSANAYGYSTGYGTVYGSYGLAATMQSMYNVARAQSQKRAAAGSGSASKPNSSPANSQTVAPEARVARNHGVFSPDASVDTGKTLADAEIPYIDVQKQIRDAVAAGEVTSIDWKDEQCTVKVSVNKDPIVKILKSH